MMTDFGTQRSFPTDAANDRLHIQQFVAGQPVLCRKNTRSRRFCKELHAVAAVDPASSSPRRATGKRGCEPRGVFMFRTMFLEAVNGMAPIIGRANMVRNTTLALALIAAAIATPVAAAIKVATYTGPATVSDQSGVFGPAGTNTFNVPYVVTFIYDTSIGRLGEETFGGTIYGGPTPIIDAKLTINGITRRFESQGNGYAGILFSDYGHAAADNASGQLGQGNYLYIGAVVSDIPSSLDANFAGTVNRIEGDFRIYTLDASGNVESDAFGTLLGGTLTITNAAVPEPASWAMMIAGFGLIGGAMRRRTAQLA